MLPFIHPSSYFNTSPIIIIDTPTYLDDDNHEEDVENFSPRILSQTSPIATVLPSNTTDDDSLPMMVDNSREMFRLRIRVDGFQPDDLNIDIQRDRLIVRGRHMVREQHSYSTFASSLTPSTNDNDDNEPDFICKEFKRTFSIPAHTDTRNARAHFFARQQILLVEIPFDNSPIVRSTLRALDIFFTIVTILFIERSMRLTYEQFSLHDPQFSRLLHEEQIENNEK